jgi:hypothetical protein
MVLTGFARFSSFMQHEVHKNGVSGRKLAILRQDILESLLDNNPLAIKLITANMPKGKSFVALKDELETDLFSKISDSELEVFDDSSDLNIARKKSIYGSILYSYKYLIDNEQRTFELLSLFPDGIGLEMFKRLTHSQKNTKNSSTSGLQQTMITDKVIRALENKSMIENNSGQIKLQSIIGKFAEAQLRRRNNLTRYYRNAFEYNRALASALNALKEDNERRALEFFNSQQGNFLKSITYCDKINLESDELVGYLDDLSSLFISISSLTGMIRDLSKKVDCFHGRDRQYIETLLLHARYFDGDFDSAFAGIKQVAPLEKLATLDRTIPSECSLADIAFNIYLMEGEALCGANYIASHHLQIYNYPNTLCYLSEYSIQLAESCKHDFVTFDIQANMGLLSIDVIDHYLSELYDKAHLERMQVFYIRSKSAPLKQQEIDILVPVNPYTKGLKGLMLAFVEPDTIKACELYQQSVGQLVHIKYYYVEALYLYSKFLHQNSLAEFDTFYDLGLQLSQKHHYRFLQYLFEQLLDPTDILYDHHNYPLPNNEDFSEYIQLLIKENKRRNGK